MANIGNIGYEKPETTLVVMLVEYWNSDSVNKEDWRVWKVFKSKAKSSTDTVEINETENEVWNYVRHLMKLAEKDRQQVFLRARWAVIDVGCGKAKIIGYGIPREFNFDTLIGDAAVRTVNDDVDSHEK